MTKVLFVSNYRENSGWSQAGRDWLLALDAAGIDVVPRPLYLNSWREKTSVPLRILEIEKRNSSNCDTVILHTLPHHFEYNGHFQKNIGLFVSETDNFRCSRWPERLKLMDEVWVTNQQQRQATTNSVGLRRLNVVPHATDITRFQRTYKPLDKLQNVLGGNFAFYTIGELVRRKNLPALIKAFHLEFHPSEPVSLVIKASKAGLSPDESAKHIGAMCDDIKASLKLYRDLHAYHREIVITRRFSDEEMMQLHSTCDCFVSASFGEAWNIGAFDSMAMGKTPILTACGGHLDYLTDESGWLVPGRLEPVFGERDTFQDLFTGYEKWTAIDVDKLRFAMREAYEDKRLRRQKAEAGIDRAYAFTYEQVGQVMKGLLDGSQATTETSGAGRREQDEQDFCSTEASPGDGEPADVY